MSDQDFQDQLSDDVASELHPEDTDPETVADDSDEPQTDADRVVPVEDDPEV